MTQTAQPKISWVESAAGRAQSFVLYDVPWREYIRLGRILGERRLRINYDRGTLEVMTLSFLHERLKHILRRNRGKRWPKNSTYGMQVAGR